MQVSAILHRTHRRRIQLGAGKLLGALDKGLSRLLEAMAAQRQREAVRIVTEYSQDRWSDCLDHEVQKTYFRSSEPSQR